MMFRALVPSIVWTFFFFFTFISAFPENNLQVRTAPGSSQEESVQILGRALSLVKRNVVYQNSTKLDRSWVGATLLKM
jgi:hypothetical protein